MRTEVTCDRELLTADELDVLLREAEYGLSTFAQLLNKPRLLAFGAGNAFWGLRATVGLFFTGIIDDTPGFAGKIVCGLQISGSKSLASENKNELGIIICAHSTVALAQMADTLRSYGLVYGEHFINCSLLHEVSMSVCLKKQFAIQTRPEAFAVIHSLARALALPSFSTVAGSWLFVELLESVTGRPGSVAECGVYQGAHSLLALAASPQLRETIYQLFDSFEGFGELSQSDPQSRSNEFADTSYDLVRETLADFPRVKVIQGYFEQTFPKLEKAEYTVVYVDCDLELSAKVCLEYFWDKVRPGGYVLVHDYWFPNEPDRLTATEDWNGIRSAVDRFFLGMDVEQVVFPETSHIAIRKPLTG